MRAQQLLSGHGAPDAAAFLWQTLFRSMLKKEKKLSGKLQGTK